MSDDDFYFDDDFEPDSSIYEPSEYEPKEGAKPGQTPTNAMTPPKKSLPKQSGIKKAYSGFTKTVGKWSAKYPNFIHHAITCSNAVLSFYKRRSIVSFVRGGFEIFETIQSSNVYSFYQAVRSADGFRYLSLNKVNIAFLFKDLLSVFPQEKVTYKNGEMSDCIHLPNDLGDIYLYMSGETPFIYFNQNTTDKDALVQFLVDEKFRELDSNFFYLQTKENSTVLTLSALHPETKPSLKAKELTKLVKQFNDIGINRSLFLYGVPGTGKSTAAFEIASALNYRTIVFSASNKLCTFDLIRNLIDILGIDLCIIDDFDQMSSTNKTLDLLEMFNKKCKVLIGIANELSGFNKAILRPGRFDNVILVDQLDDACISSVLGDLTPTYMSLVKKWPIAFIHELAKNKPFMTEKELMNYAKELNERVRQQVGSSAVGKWKAPPATPKPKAATKKSKKAAVKEKPIVISKTELEEEFGKAIEDLKASHGELVMKQEPHVKETGT